MGDLSSTEFASVLLAFRVIFGLVFAAHGIPKMKSLEGTAGWFESLGMKPGALHARAAASTEIATGVMLAAGLLTPFAAAGVVGVMVVAGWTVHRKNGFAMVNDGWEATFIFGLIAVVIAALGPGTYSLDEALGLADSLNGWLGLAIAGGLGVAGGAAHLAVFFRPAEPTTSP